MTEIIVALDVDTIHEQQEILKDLAGTVRYFKVGLRLFTAHGKRSVELVHQHGGKVFLDLKLHDIPQTVAHAVHEARKMRVHAVSIHLAGGADMVRAAVELHPRPKLWGVTVLTSLTDVDLHVLHPRASVRPMVDRLAKMGLEQGIDGVICSGHEVEHLRKTLGPDAYFVTPGIRPAGHKAHDQKRLMTPADAAKLGIRYVVIGRPITKAPDKLAKAQEILSEMRNALPSSLAAPPPAKPGRKPR